MHFWVSGILPEFLATTLSGHRLLICCIATFKSKSLHKDNFSWSFRWMKIIFYELEKVQMQLFTFAYVVGKRFWH